MKKVILSLLTMLGIMVVAGCGVTSQAVVYTPNQIACQRVASGHQHAPDAEACSKAVLHSFRRATGTGPGMCWVQGKAVMCVPRYHVDKWQVRFVIRDNGTRWHTDGVMYPMKGTFHKAPLSGRIT